MRQLKLRTRLLKDGDQKMMFKKKFRFFYKFSFFSEAFFTNDLLQKSYWIKIDELRCSQVLCKVPKSTKIPARVDVEHGELYNIDAVFRDMRELFSARKNCEPCDIF